MGSLFDEIDHTSDDRTMTRKELLAALDKAPDVYVWVRAMEDDGCYFRAIKRDVRHRIANDLPEAGERRRAYLAFADEETGTLYIN